MVEEKPFLLTILSIALGFAGIFLIILGLTGIITSPQSGLPFGEDQLALLAQLTSASAYVDIQIGSVLFILGIIILIAGSGLHQLRMWALQTVMVLLLVLVVLCAVYAISFLGFVTLPFDLGGFEAINGLILPLFCYCLFFFIYLIIVRHYFD